MKKETIPAKHQLIIDQIINVACDEMSVSVEDFWQNTKSRKTTWIKIRAIVINAAVKVKVPPVNVGSYLNKDHSSALHFLQRWDELVNPKYGGSPYLQEVYNKCLKSAQLYIDTFRTPAEHILQLEQDNAKLQQKIRQYEKALRERSEALVEHLENREFGGEMGY